MRPTVCPLSLSPQKPLSKKEILEGLEDVRERTCLLTSFTDSLSLSYHPATALSLSVSLSPFPPTAPCAGDKAADRPEAEEYISGEELCSVPSPSLPRHLPHRSPRLLPLLQPTELAGVWSLFHSTGSVPNHVRSYSMLCVPG